jgi:bifunctional ADP-heptose synthase (sugar kinase/adenylyltransferase)
MIKITLIGEICEDFFTYGIIDRICPEAPVPIFKPKYTKNNLGMIGNVMNNIKYFLPNSESFLYSQKTRITKTRMVDIKSNQMIIRIDEGEDKLCDKLIFDNDLEKNIISSDIVIVSDYNKGFLSDLDLIKIGSVSKLSILDSKRKLSDEITKKFSFVKLNEFEYNNNKDLKNIENILITLGSKGVKFQNKMYPTKKIKETIDVCGAGDTFVSGFISKYYSTKNISESIKFANKNCSKVVSKKGVNIPN